MINKIIRFFLENKLVSILIILGFIGWGIITAPFNWSISWLPRDPVPVDAIPDIGANEQIVFTEWEGRSPQDVEDQVTYPLTTALLGLPDIEAIRSSSAFGFSSIYIIFKDNVDFYWSRSRILEKLNSLPSGTLPAGVQPSLGPDATALGQVFEYTLEGCDKSGKPAGGWSPQELRSLQDFYVRYGLEAADGVSEVASVGGYIKEYQVDIDPDAMKSNNVNVIQIMQAVRKCNLDIGARTIEYNKAEYLIRSLGYVKSISDIENAVVAVNDNVPIRVKDVAHVHLGPALRRGGLDKDGAEAVGGIAVARYGSNPMQVIQNIKEKIKEIEPGLPSKKLADGRISKVTIVPFYDRSGLIKETLGTLKEGLSHEILISILVVIVLVMNLRASIIISSMLPIGVLMTFIIMKYAHIEANIVALSGIAIAIGVMVDVGIIITENIVRHLEMKENEHAEGKNLLAVVYNATTEVASAVITTLATIIVSFLPVFAMQAAEGKLFRPLAFTKTFAIFSSLLIGLIAIPMLTHWLFSIKFDKKKTRIIWNSLLLAGGVIAGIYYTVWGGIVLCAFGINNLSETYLPESKKKFTTWINTGIIVATLFYFLSKAWLPLGAENRLFANFLFVLFIVGIVLSILLLVIHFYAPILKWCLDHKGMFLLLPLTIILFGILSWLGFNRVFGFAARASEMIGWNVQATSGWQAAARAFPGEGKEFMPPLNEGSFLLMPSTMPHSGIAENVSVLKEVDKAVGNIPEVSSVVGKWGRANTALDPAPISMFEIIINYKPEYILDENGNRERFKMDGKGKYVRDKTGELVKDPNGEYFRQWRPDIHTPDDIWQEIVGHAKYPGMTSSPKLQPIQTRLIMLSTGMRAPVGIKVFGPDLETIQQVGFELEKLLKEVPGIVPSSVFADRVVGKPYLEIEPDREAIARYGLTIQDFQNTLQVALGGMPLTTTVEGRERYPVRVRYAREYRDNPDDIKTILIPTPASLQVPLSELASIKYVSGPQVIKSENTFLDGYVIFDKKPGFAEVNVVENAQKILAEKIASGEFKVPKGVSYVFTGSYQDEIRATKRLAIVMPLSLALIFLILYFQFKSVRVSLMIFSGIFVAFAGGFIMLWLYAQPWFMNFSIAGHNMRTLFQMHPINLSVAVWVGFIALFGVATNDGVIMGTYLKQVFSQEKPRNIANIRETVLHGGRKRIRPAVMTAACAIISLMPILSSTGKGSDIMVPMAIPLFGGMAIQVITMFVVPVLYSAWQESKFKKTEKMKSINVTGDEKY